MGHHQNVGRRRRGIVCGAMIAGAAVGGCAGRISPAGAVSPDRPGYTDTPPVLPSGAAQLEVGVTDDRAGSAEYLAVGEGLLRLGIGARSELRLFANSFATRSMTGLPSVSGAEDPKVGIKTTLRSAPDSLHSAAPNVAALVAVTVPFGARSFRARGAQPEAKLALNWTTPSPLSVYANIGVVSFYNDVGRAGRGWLSIATWWSVNPKVSVFAEGLNLTQIIGSGSGTVANYADAGATYLINDRFQLDARIGRGVGTVTSSDRFIGVGFAKRW